MTPSDVVRKMTLCVRYACYIGYKRRLVTEFLTWQMKGADGNAVEVLGCLIARRHLEWPSSCNLEAVFMPAPQLERDRWISPQRARAMQVGFEGGVPLRSSGLSFSDWLWIEQMDDEELDMEEMEKELERGEQEGYDQSDMPEGGMIMHPNGGMHCVDKRLLHLQRT